MNHKPGDTVHIKTAHQQLKRSTFVVLETADSILRLDLTI